MSKPSAGTLVNVVLLALACAGCTPDPATPAKNVPLSSPPLTDQDQTAVTLANKAQQQVKGNALKYPQPARGSQIDEYFGRQVADPYRWLEDPDSPETRAWIEAENAITFDYLEAIPARQKIKQRLTKLWNYERYGVPVVRGGQYVFSRNDGLQNQNVLYVADGIEAKPRLLLDPNTLSPDGTIALSGHELSDDGRLLAYGLADAGSDWQRWKVRRVDNGQDLDDELKWIKFSGVSWAHDSSGFYYSRYDEPTEATKLTGQNYYQKLFFHKLGEPQSKDRLIYQRKDEKEWGFDGEVTEDGHFLVVTVRRGTEPKNQVFYLDLQKPDASMQELVTGWDAQYQFLSSRGSVFWFLTDLDAPRYRVIAVDVEHPERKAWKEIIPEADSVLEAALVVADTFLAVYLKDAHSEVERFDLDGKRLGRLELPGLGTVAGFDGRRSDRETFYAYTSFTTPTTIYHYEVAKNRSDVFRTPKVDFDPERYETKQVFYTSRDGTRVPMFITARKGVTQNGKSPTYLYGYGGFNISLSPTFAVSRIVWLEMGGVFAMPNLRGGGEYGRAWHEAGMKEHKQNVFDDFIAAAEYLVRENYTTHQLLAASGRSNGGLLVAACMVQRPDLFGAVLPGVGVLDMLRFQKFTIGWAWVNEYGSAENKADFPHLWAYSPLHNIKPGENYPPTFIETADHDDRVVPAHSFKFAAELQHAQASPAPILIRIETRAGHGAGTPISKQIDDITDAYAFLVKVLGMELPAGFATASP